MTETELAEFIRKNAFYKDGILTLKLKGEDCSVSEIAEFYGFRLE